MTFLFILSVKKKSSTTTRNSLAKVEARPLSSEYLFLVGLAQLVNPVLLCVRLRDGSVLLDVSHGSHGACSCVVDLVHFVHFFKPITALF